MEDGTDEIAEVLELQKAEAPSHDGGQLDDRVLNRIDERSIQEPGLVYGRAHYRLDDIEPISLQQRAGTTLLGVAQTGIRAYAGT